MSDTFLAALCMAAALGGSSCAAFKDKPQLAAFARRHPIAAFAIGNRSELGTNITSNAVRISTRLGLDNRANGDGRGTQVNALRHSLWQASITARFGSRIAEAAGNAYERNAVQQNSRDYPDRYHADEATDLRNNAVGRRIGAGGGNMKQLAVKLLDEYRSNGLWTAAPVQENGKTVWRISQTRLDKTTHQTAVAKLAALDGNGMTAAERQQAQQQSQNRRR